MNVFEITVRHRQESGWPVATEYSRPGELSRRTEGTLLLEDYAVELRCGAISGGLPLEC